MKINTVFITIGLSLGLFFLGLFIGLNYETESDYTYSEKFFSKEFIDEEFFFEFLTKDSKISNYTLRYNSNFTFIKKYSLSLCLKHNDNTDILLNFEGDSFLEIKDKLSSFLKKKSTF